MSAIDSTPESYSTEHSFDESFNETKEIDDKVNRLWLIIAPVISLIGAVVAGVLAITASIWFLIPSVPLFIASGILIWYARSSSETKKVGPSQESSDKLSLEKAIETLGWKKLAAVLTSEDFELAYCDQVEEMNLNKLLDFYEEAFQELQGTGLNIPTPSQWKKKLSFETEGLNYPLLMERFSLYRLIDYSLIDPDELKQSFAAFANSSSIKTIIEEYEKVHAQIRETPDYSIAKPKQWKAKLMEESNGLKYQALSAGHSIPDLIRHELIDPDELAKSFTAYAESVPLFQALGEYEKTAKLTELFPYFPFSFPSIGVKKFKEETANLKASEIAANPNYPIHKLLQYNIIGENEHYLLQQIADEKMHFQQLKQSCEHAAKDKLLKAKEETKNRADQIAGSLILEQRELFNLYSRNIKAAEASARQQTEIERGRVSSYEKAHPKMTQTETAYFNALKKNCTDSCYKIKQTLNDKIKTYQKENQQALLNVEEAIEAAYKLKTDADQKFNASMKLLQQDVERQIAPSRDDLTKRILQIDRTYDQFKSDKLKK